MKVLQRLMAFSLALMLLIPPLSAQATDGGSGNDDSGASDSYVRINNPWKGFYLYEASDGKVRYGFTAVNDHSSHWQIEAKNGHKRLKNRATGHYLHSQSVTDANITNALESSDIPDGWTSDTWDITDAPDNPGGVNIVSTRNSSWIVNVQIENGFIQGNGWAQKPWGSAVWKLEPAEEQAPIRIANPWDGSYLYEEAGEIQYGSPALNDTASHWFVEEKDGYKRFRNRATGHYLHSQDVTEQTITHPIGIADIGSGWTSDLWTITDADGGINLISSRNADWVINIQGTGNGADGVVRVNGWTQKSWGSAIWQLEQAADSTPKRIKNQWKGTYLYEDNGQVKYGEPVYTDKTSQWVIEDTAGGAQLRNLATGKYVSSIDYVGAAPLETTISPAADATWKVEGAKDDGGNELDGYVTLRSTVDTNSYVNVQNQDGYAQGNNWAQATWGSAQWKLEEPASPTAPVNPYIRIKNNWLQLYLYEDNGIVKYGNALASDEYAQWTVEDIDGVKRIKNRATDHYLNMEGVSGSRDALKSSDLVLGSSAGDWNIETYQGYKIMSKPGDESGSYVNVENKLKHAQYGVVEKDWGSPKWEFVPVTESASEYVRLKNSYRGTYLYEAADGKVAYGQPEAGDETSHWALEQGEQGMRIVNRSTGHLLTNENINRDPANHPNGHLDPLESLDIDPTWGSVQWAVYGVEGSSNKVFSNDWNGNAVIHVEDQTGYGQASSIPVEWGSAQWVLETAPNPPIVIPEGDIRIKNRASGQYLYENGNNVVLYGTPAVSNAASHWRIRSEEGIQSIENRATGNVISIANLQSYVETTASPAVSDTKVRWAVEQGPEASTYLLRSAADGYEDAYIHTEDSQGYAQYELRSMESRGVQWVFEAAPAEAIISPWDNGPANAVTPALPETNYVRIMDGISGKALIARNGGIVVAAPAVNDSAAQWLPQDYNGHKRLVNRSTGQQLAVDEHGTAITTSNGAALAAQWKVEDYAGYKLVSNASVEGQYLVSNGAGGAASQTVSPSLSEAHWLMEAVREEARYEAEEAFMTGGVAASGTYATGFVAEDATLLFSVNAAEADSYDAVIRYRNSGGAVRTLSLYINGLRQAGEVEFLATGNASTNKAVSLPLRAGMNTVSLQYDPGDSGLVEVDALTVSDSVNKNYRGATVPFTTYEAEHGTTNGTLLAPDRTFKTFSSEASGRNAVRLDATGQYVEFKTTKQANAMVVRYIIPDSVSGGGTEATLSLYVNGENRGKLELTSEHSWVYGKYPWSNNPDDGDAHRFFDESHLLIGDVPAGATVRLQKESDDTAAYYIVDLIELEQASDAYAKPDGYLSVTDYGAVADDATDDWDAFHDAIDAARELGTGVWIPTGLFLLEQGPLHVDNVTIRGAGMWHTTLQGAGFLVEGSKVRVYDLLLDVNVTARHDELREAGFDGTFGTGSVIQNVWIEHAKAGIWSMRSDEGVSTDGLYVGGVRIRNTYADGINFTTGTSNSMIEQTHIRNSGDDSIALWSQKPQGVSDEESRTSGNTIRFNSIQLPWLADNVAIFGGRNNKVQDNVLSDTVGFGAGIAISTRFDPVAFDGTTIVERNTLIRTGGREHNWGQDFGAIWIFTGDKAIDADILIRNNLALDSTYQGLYINGPHPISNTGHKILIHNYVVDGTGTWGIHVNNSVTGSVELDNVIIRNTKVGPVFNAMGTAFELRSPSTTQPGGSSSESSGSGSTGGGGSVPITSTKQDSLLNEAVTAGKQEIVINLTSETEEGKAVFTVAALRAAASSLPNAVILVKFGGLGYYLPMNIIAILEAAGNEQVLKADGKLTIKLAKVTDSAASDIEAKAASSGFHITGEPVSFELVLETEEQVTSIHQFGKHFLTRTFIIEGNPDKNHSSVVVFDPVTGLFRTVPALFTFEGNKTVVTVKSATNSIYAVAVSESSFGDIAKHWAKDDITLLANKRLVSGMSVDVFEPQRNISRAEFATLLVTALGLDTSSSGKIAFSDVKAAAWYAPFVDVAARYGIVSGIPDGSFRPDREVTRAEMAVMLAQAMKLTQVQPLSTDTMMNFSRDNDRIAEWARSSVEELVRTGIMVGKSAESFAPHDKATRAEAVVTLRRMLQAIDFLDKD
jgi:hypothetical protein